MYSFCAGSVLGLHDLFFLTQTFCFGLLRIEIGPFCLVQHSNVVTARKKRFAFSFFQEKQMFSHDSCMHRMGLCSCYAYNTLVMRCCLGRFDGASDRLRGRF